MTKIKEELLNNYRCCHCKKIVERNSNKKWIKSYCSKTGKDVRLQIFYEKTLYRKRCTYCTETKLIGLFVKNKYKRDGYSHVCQKCERRISRERSDKYKDWKSGHQSVYRSGLSKEKRREMGRKSYRKQKLTNPEKVKARQQFSYVVKKGLLIRLPCEVCGDEKTHGHHTDYSKPSLVVWLCQRHHVEAHGKKYRVKTALKQTNNNTTKE